MRVRGEEILAAIVVEVGQRDAPAGQMRRELAHVGRKRGIAKLAFAGVVKQRIGLAGQGREDKIRKPVVIEIAEVHAHGRNRLAVVRQRHARRQRDLRERAVAVVAEEKIRLRVVGDEDVREAVAVVIRNRETHAFADRFRNARFHGDVFEGAVALVPVE